MDKNLKNARYVEPDNYIPKEIRKKFKLGEYANTGTAKKAPATKKSPAKK